METLRRKGKDWGDIVITRDPEESELEYVVKKFPITKTIHIKRLKIPIFMDRFENEVADEEVDYISQVPLKVVKSRESGKYIVVEGIRYLVEGKSQNIKKFSCTVIDEVDLDAWAYIHRLVHVFKDHKPFHILERARALEEIKRLVISKFRKNEVFSHGGDRRSTDSKSYITLVEVLKEKLPYKKYLIETLLRFNKNTGPLGNEYLYKILKSNNQDLSINRIHRLNPKMKKMGLRKEIEAEIDRLKWAKHNEDEIKEKVGIICYDALFQTIDESISMNSKSCGATNGCGDGANESDLNKKERKKHKNNNAKDSGGEDGKNDGDDSNPAEVDADEKSGLGETYPINRKVLRNVMKVLRYFRIKIDRFDDDYQIKPELTSMESLEFYQKLDDLTNDFTKVKRMSYKAVFGR